MRQDGKRNHRLTLVSLFLFCLAIVACSATAGETLSTEEPTPGSTTPTEVIEAREAVLDFLRDGANECVPPAAAEWRSEIGAAPEGFGVYRFHSNDCLMTVAYSLQAEETAYHVALHNGTGGFCWQATVSDHGRVVNTGSAAALMPELTEAAATYCREQGYQYEVQQQQDGSSCGVCSFPDGNSCKAWLFYQGECEPVQATAAP